MVRKKDVVKAVEKREVRSVIIIDAMPREHGRSRVTVEGK